MFALDDIFEFYMRVQYNCMLSENSLRELQMIKAKKVLVQIPEGLKLKALDVADFLENRGFVPVISTEPCFGACDIREDDAKALGCDAILHIGHTDFGLKTSLPVVYDAWQSSFDPVKVAKSEIQKLAEYKSIGILATAQHLAAVGKLKAFMESQGKRVFTARHGVLKEAQVLGCNYANAIDIEKDVDCFIFIGSGRFHYSGLLESVSKPVFFINAEEGSMKRVTEKRDRLIIQRQMRIEKARGLDVFGVFVSTKPGQKHIRTAEAVRKKLIKAGKRTVLISADMLTPEKLMGMGIEVLVNTACPRIYDDQKLFGMVILNPEDAEKL